MKSYNKSKLVLRKDENMVTMTEKQSLYQLRVNLGWTQKMLSKESGVNPVSIMKAEKGGRLTAVSAKKIADAFARAYEREIRPLDIEGLVIE